jgi:hypothetical protein
MTYDPEAHHKVGKEVCQFGSTASCCTNVLVMAGNKQVDRTLPG